MSGEIYSRRDDDIRSVINSIGLYRHDHVQLFDFIVCLVELFIVLDVFGKQLDLFWLSRSYFALSFVRKYYYEIFI